MKIDRRGFVWVNLASDTRPQDFKIRQLGEGAAIVGDKASRDGCWVTGWEIQGKFNWKVAAQQTENPNNPNVSPAVEALEALKKPLGRVFEFRYKNHLALFPPATVQRTSPSPFWYAIAIFPNSATTSTVRCDVFSAQYSNAELFSGRIRAQIEDEVEAIVWRLQRQWARVCSGAGAELLPGTPSVQRKIMSDLKSHLKLERLAGDEVHPAAITQGRTDVCEKADALCRKLDREGTPAGGGLDW